MFAAQLKLGYDNLSVDPSFHSFDRFGHRYRTGRVLVRSISRLLFVPAILEDGAV